MKLCVHVHYTFCQFLTSARGRVGRVTDCGVRGLGLDSNLWNRNQFSFTSGQGWLGPKICTGKWVKKIVSCGGVVDLAVEQPQLFRKRPPKQNKNSLIC